MLWLGTLFSPWGRIGRRRFWLAILIAAALAILPQVATVGAYLAVGAGASKPPPSTQLELTTTAFIGLATLVVSWCCATYLSVAACARRYNDRGRSSWWVLSGFVPVIGPISMLIELGFVRGTSGRNRYGAAPRRDAAEFRAIFGERNVAIEPEKGRVSNLFAILVAWVLNWANLVLIVALFQRPH